ncbi:MAG TPA: type VII secretion target [Mycobacteriales bacterium]|nr:type VII secretion target [Mycobacteriales bacterium]
MIPSRPAAGSHISDISDISEVSGGQVVGAPIAVQPDPVQAAGARLDRVAESLRAMSTAAAGSLTRAGPAAGDPGLEPVCASAATASRIRLAGLGDWSTLLAGRLRQAVQAYGELDARVGSTVTREGAP